jgi:gamma-glutamyltranspeptidase / glutathione hydrolase
MTRAAAVALTLLFPFAALAGSTATASKAALSTAHPLATKAGLAVLQRGGNAIDASVAVAFALSVVHPQAGSLGGGGFLVYYDASTRGVWTLDFRETAPLATTREAFAKTTTGALAAGVPGTVAGLDEMHRKFGTKPWKELLAAAIALSREERAADAELERDRKAKNIELPKDAELAATLQRLADVGARDFYDGDLSVKLVEGVKAAGGILGHRDLRDYEPVWRAPLKLKYGPYDIITAPPPSSGGIVIGETLNILSGDDLAASGFQTLKSLHLLVEAQRRAAIDRARYIGDPRGARIPYRELLSQQRAEAWRKTIQPMRVIATVALAEPRDLTIEGEHTTHFTIADAHGNIACVTTSLGDLFGSGFAAPSLGFFLNNSMNDFTSGVNVADPGKRAATSMSPAIILRDGKPFLALGTRGGAAIPTTILQVFLNVAVYGKTLAAAVAAPRYHHQALPEEMSYEKELAPKSMIDALNAIGHAVRAVDAIGDVHAIQFEKGRMTAVADPRRGGAAGGF